MNDLRIILIAGIMLIISGGSMVYLLDNSYMNSTCNVKNYPNIDKIGNMGYISSILLVTIFVYSFCTIIVFSSIRLYNLNIRIKNGRH